MFVKGIVVSSQPSSEYEGVVYDRFLTIKTSAGSVVRIFDFDCLSEILKDGDECEVLIKVAYTLAQSRIKKHENDAQPTNFKIGTVIENPWKTLPISYRELTIDISKASDFVLVADENIGGILIHRDNFETSIQEGDKVILNDIPRFDLIGIL